VALGSGGPGRLEDGLEQSLLCRRIIGLPPFHRLGVIEHHLDAVEQTDTPGQLTSCYFGPIG
jgi:hypothetical protein